PCLPSMRMPVMPARLCWENWPDSLMSRRVLSVGLRETVIASAPRVPVMLMTPLLTATDRSLRDSSVSMVQRWDMIKISKEFELDYMQENSGRRVRYSTEFECGNS